MSSEDFVAASGDQVARPQTEAGVAASLLEEIRFRIWHNTGCSDDAAEGAAAAVYDLFLDQKAIAADLLAALKDAVADLEQTLHWRGEGWECSEDELLGSARAAIAKASGQ